MDRFAASPSTRRSPSVFSHEILNANPYAYLDDAPLEERRARAVEMRRTLPEAVLSEVGRLDPAAIAEVCEDAWPEVRDADEVHDALQTLVALPETFAARPVEHWRPLIDELTRARRAGRFDVDGRVYHVAAERVRLFQTIFPGAHALDVAADVAAAMPSSRIEAIVVLVQGWLAHLGPATTTELSACLGLDVGDVDEAMLRIEATGWALRGRFRSSASDPGLEWCERRLLARIHRLTLGTLRREIAPVTAAEFMRWLLTWQHVTPGTQLSGERGTLEIISQLQGFETPANAWERQVIGRRVINYDPEDLDRLCLTGLVGWGRLSPASGDARCGTVAESPRRADERRADRVLRARRRCVDDAAAAHRRRREHHGSEPRRPRDARRARTCRRVVLRRHRSRHQTAESGSRDGSVGAGRGRTRDRRRLRQPPRADRSQAPRRSGRRQSLATETQRGTMVAPPRNADWRGRGDERSDLLDAAPPVRRRFPRPVGARERPAGVAGTARHIPPARGPRRSARRPVRLGVHRRAVRPARRGGVDSRDAPSRADRRSRQRVGRGSAQPRRHSRAGRSRSCALWTCRELSRRRSCQRRAVGRAHRRVLTPASRVALARLHVEDAGPGHANLDVVPSAARDAFRRIEQHVSVPERVERQIERGDDVGRRFGGRVQRAARARRGRAQCVERGAWKLAGHAGHLDEHDVEHRIGPGDQRRQRAVPEQARVVVAVGEDEDEMPSSRPGRTRERDEHRVEQRRHVSRADRIDRHAFRDRLHRHDLMDCRVERDHTQLLVRSQRVGHAPDVALEAIEAANHAPARVHDERHVGRDFVSRHGGDFLGHAVVVERKVLRREVGHDRARGVHRHLHGDRVAHRAERRLGLLPGRHDDGADGHRRRGHLQGFRGDPPAGLIAACRRASSAR